MNKIVLKNGIKIEEGLSKSLIWIYLKEDGIQALITQSELKDFLEEKKVLTKYKVIDLEA